MRKLLIANPTYSPGSVSRLSQIQAYQSFSAPDMTIYDWEQTSSIVTWAFNAAWALALNLRETEGLTHFLLIHSDVRPVQTNWLKLMFDTLDEHNGDLLSVVIPIKDDRGLSSTAIDTDPWRPMRLTMHQIHHEFPETWCAPEALFNTGLMLVDIRKPWVEQICFNMRDKIARDDTGKWSAYVEPEDWNFSRQCRRLQVRALITRKIIVQHFGTYFWRNDQVWGEQVDSSNAPLVVKKLTDGVDSKTILSGQQTPELVRG